MPSTSRISAAHAQLAPHVRRREPLRLEVEEVALLVVQLADDADPEAEHGERERDQAGGAERERSGVRERVGREPVLLRGTRGNVQGRERRASERRRPLPPEIQISRGVPWPGAFESIAVESHAWSASTNGPMSAGIDGIREATPTIRASTCVSWKSSVVVAPTPPAARAISGETTTGINWSSVGCVWRSTRRRPVSGNA